jgi:outer membrane lipoprotein carrier protein
MDAETIVEKTLETYQNTTLISAEIKQTRIIKNINRKNVAKGHIFLAHENKIRIEYKSPQEQIIVSDGDSIWMYTPMNEQVLLRPATGSENFMFQYFQDANPTLITDDEIINKTPCYLIELTPNQDAGGDIRKIHTWINQKTFLPDQIKLTDINDNIVIYTLSDIRQKDAIKEGLFQFTIPENVEVFRE